ncbi:hypothetical protein, partial [Victivallis vadensis]|uniref:hypothetical protein n=1 Tax=Victivallis vadensis TaxID=172901 RepID=UPI0023F12F8B
VIPSHSFAALTALVVRRVSGCATLFACRLSGYADRPMPCLCLVARPPKGIERVPGSGTLPFMPE